MNVKKFLLVGCAILLTLVLFFAGWNTGSDTILFVACVVAALLIIGCAYPVWR